MLHNIGKLLSTNIISWVALVTACFGLLNTGQVRGGGHLLHQLSLFVHNEMLSNTALCATKHTISSHVHNYIFIYFLCF